MKKFKTTLLIFAIVLLCTLVISCARGATRTESLDTVATTVEEKTDGLSQVAEELGVSKANLAAALGDPSQGRPDFAGAAEKLGVSASVLEKLISNIQDDVSIEVEAHTITLNGVDFEITYEVFDWANLPSDIVYERQPIISFDDANGTTHYYETVSVPTGNLNWYQAAFLAEDAGGYLACPTSEEENSFVFSLVNDKKYFWPFSLDGGHYGISIGPFLGGYQPDGSSEPDGGWCWLSGDAWVFENWAQNLDDGVIDKDPRPNDQPNDSGGNQSVMGFGEMNLPVPTWGDYFDSVGTYNLKKSPGSSYGFIIEYESDPLL
jgi:hypothetical protein